jgi:AraC-like DNA-binding protein
LSPRAWRGLQTFQRAVRLKALHADWPWAQVATAAGYVDQAHLIREFRNYVGITPGRYATNGANLTSCFLDLDQIT